MNIYCVVALIVDVCGGSQLTTPVLSSGSRSSELSFPSYLQPASYAYDGFSNVTDSTSLTPEQLQLFGGELIDNFFGYLHSNITTDSKNLMVADGFQLLRKGPNGVERYLKEDAPAPNPSLLGETWQDLVTTAPSPDHVVLRFNQTSNSSALSPRILTFARNNETGDWQVAADAEFGSSSTFDPCVIPSDLQGAATPSTSDAAGLHALLKGRIFSRWASSVGNGTESAEFADQVQMQDDLGWGISNKTQYVHDDTFSPHGTYDQTYSEVLSTRVGDNLLVTSYNLFYFPDTQQLGNPAMSVFSRDQSTGQWELISFAAFATGFDGAPILYDLPANCTASAPSPAASGALQSKATKFYSILSIAIFFFVL